jgi:hypothetical protein
MARRKHFAVDEMPDEIRSKVNDLIQGGVTYRAIAEKLAELGHPIAASSLCRYGQEFLGRMERLRIVNGQAQAILEESGGNPLRLEEAATQISLGVMTEFMLKLENLDGADPVEVMQTLARLQTSSVQRERLRIQWREEQESKTKAAAADVCKSARAGGLSEEQVKEIEERILGIVR